MSRTYFYAANLIPVGRPIPVIDYDEGAIEEWWHKDLCERERKNPELVKVLIDHDPKQVAGHFTHLTVTGGWLNGTFILNDTEAGITAAERLDVGSPISVGFDPETSSTVGQSRTIHRHAVKLNEASLVTKSAYPGAQVTLKIPAVIPTETPKPRPAGQVIYGDGTLVRRNLGQVLGLR